MKMFIARVPELTICICVCLVPVTHEIGRFEKTSHPHTRKSVLFRRTERFITRRRPVTMSLLTTLLNVTSRFTRHLVSRLLRRTNVQMRCIKQELAPQQQDKRPVTTSVIMIVALTNMHTAWFLKVDRTPKHQKLQSRRWSSIEWLIHGAARRIANMSDVSRNRHPRACSHEMSSIESAIHVSTSCRGRNRTTTNTHDKHQYTQLGKQTEQSIAVQQEDNIGMSVAACPNIHVTKRPTRTTLACTVCFYVWMRAHHQH